jgi:signal transduction histidine kinase
MIFSKLYLRIWLAVVMAVAVLTLMVGWVWRLAAEQPVRDVEIRNQAGQIIGKGRSRAMADDEDDRRRGRELQDALQRYGAVLIDPLPNNDESAPFTTQTTPPNAMAHPNIRKSSRGPEFLVRMHDGQMVHMHLMRPPASFWNRPPFGFAWMLVWVGIAVALATYPIIRKLTRRLESLQDGVQQWGQGDLSIRIPETGHDEVAFLAKRFNQAAQRVQTLVQSHEALLASQKSLLANASHELRSPLTRIRMGLELMGAPSSTSFKTEISRNISELDQLIEEILLASRLDAREADLGTIESVDLMGLAAEECARVGAELEVQGDASPVLPVQGVTKLLRRALRNLLENARRHAAGDITVSLARIENRAVIRVGDRGPGVPPELRERIFEPFYRLPGATERDGGVGLGLALVKSIAIRHGGAVYCEDRPGGGASFVIELPSVADQ